MVVSLKSVLMPSQKVSAKISYKWRELLSKKVHLDIERCRLVYLLIKGIIEAHLCAKAQFSFGVCEQSELMLIFVHGRDVSTVEESGSSCHGQDEHEWQSRRTPQTWWSRS